MEKKKTVYSIQNKKKKKILPWQGGSNKYRSVVIVFMRENLNCHKLLPPKIKCLKF